MDDQAEVDQSGMTQDTEQTCPERSLEDTTAVASEVNHNYRKQTTNTTAAVLSTGDASAERADNEQVGSSTDLSVGEAECATRSVSRNFSSGEQANPAETDLCAAEDTLSKAETDLPTTEAAPESAEEELQSAELQSAQEAQGDAQKDVNAADTVQTSANTASSLVSSLGNNFAETNERNVDNASDSLEIGGKFPGVGTSDIDGKTRNASDSGADHQTSRPPDSGMGHTSHGDGEKRESSTLKPGHDLTLPDEASKTHFPSGKACSENRI